MLRLLLYIVLAYIVWKVIQVVSRVMSTSHHQGEDPFANQPPPKPQQTFKDVKDADFEELPPDDKK